MDDERLEKPYYWDDEREEPSHLVKGQGLIRGTTNFDVKPMKKERQDYCEVCGEPAYHAPSRFKGGRSRYCLDCKEEMRLQHDRERYARNREILQSKRRSK